MQKSDFMNLNAIEINRRKCYNYEKKNHITKRCKKSKSTQQLDTLKEYFDEKIREPSWEKKIRAQVLKENEQKNNFEEDLKYEKKCVSFTTRIYRSLHSMTLVIDKKTKRIKSRSTFDQKNFMFKFITTRYFLKAEQNMCYFKLEKNLEYIHKMLKKHDEISDACEFLKKFENTNEVREFYEEIMKMNEIQSFKCNEHRWTNIIRMMRTCQEHEIDSGHTDINNEDTIVLYDSKNVVNYINLDYELRLRAFEETNVVRKNDENMITVFECDNLSNMIFRKKRDSANYLMISTTHSIKSSLKFWKKTTIWKKKSWDYT